MKAYVLLLSVVSVSTSIGMELDLLDKGTARAELKRALEFNNIDNVANIMKEHPSVLYGDEDDLMLPYIHHNFANAFIAVSTKDIFKYNYFKKLVHCGFDLDICDRNYASLLIRAIAQNDGDKYLDLLKAGVCVNVEDKYGRSPLYYAVQKGNAKAIEKLLLYGAVVKNDIKRSPLYLTYASTYKLPLQACCACHTDRHELSNIPCINRHLGLLICDCCCAVKQYKCPICFHSLGEFGS
jgi:hypothetical protein